VQNAPVVQSPPTLTTAPLALSETAQLSALTKKSVTEFRPI